MLRQLQPVSRNPPWPGRLLPQTHLLDFSAGFLTADVRFYLCSLPLLSSGCEMSYFQTRLLLFVQTLSFQRATEGSVGNQSTAKGFRDVTGVFSEAHTDSTAQPVGSCHPPQPRGAGRRPVCDLRCPRVTLARQCHHSPCPGGHRAGWDRHSTSRPFSGSFQSKSLSHSRSGSDS